MTTLAAIQGDGWCVLACDSRTTVNEGRIIDGPNPKIIENNGILIAGAGNGRGSNIMQFGWKAPRPGAVKDLDAWMTTTFIPTMRQVFMESGYDMKDDGSWAEHGSEFLVAVRGVVYHIFEDYGWERDARNIYATGSGNELALGALAVLNAGKSKNTDDAVKKITKAVEVAISYDNASGGPVHVFVQADSKTV